MITDRREELNGQPRRGVETVERAACGRENGPRPGTAFRTLPLIELPRTGSQTDFLVSEQLSH